MVVGVVRVRMFGVDVDVDIGAGRATARPRWGACGGDTKGLAGGGAPKGLVGSI